MPLTLAWGGQVAEPGDYIFDALLGLCRDRKDWEALSWGGKAVMGERGPCLAGKPSGDGDGVGSWL